MTMRGFWTLVAGCVVALTLAGGAAGAGQGYSSNGEAFRNWENPPVPPSPTAADVLAGNSAAGDLYANVMLGSITAQREFRRALPSIFSYSQTAHFQNRADTGSDRAYASVGDGYYEVCPTTMCAPGSRWVMWDVPFIVNETAKRNDGFLGYRSAVSGFATGVSRMLGESSAIGLAVGYDERKLTGRDRIHMRSRADTFHAALYGGTNIGSFFFDAYAGYSRSWNRSSRHVYPGGGNPTQKWKANYNDTVLSAGFKISHVWILPAEYRVTPSLGLDFSHVRADAHGEKLWGANGTGFLNMKKSTYHNVAMPLMVSANKTFSSDFLKFRGVRSLWTPEVRAGWVPQFGSKHAKVKVAGITGQPGPYNGSYAIKSNPLARSYGTVGAGLKIKIYDKVILAIDYDFTFASKYTNHSITGMYGVSF